MPDFLLTDLRHANELSDIYIYRLCEANFGECRRSVKAWVKAVRFLAHSRVAGTVCRRSSEAIRRSTSPRSCSKLHQPIPDHVRLLHNPFLDSIQKPANFGFGFAKPLSQLLAPMRLLVTALKAIRGLFAGMSNCSPPNRRRSTEDLPRPRLCLFPELRRALQQPSNIAAPLSLVEGTRMPVHRWQNLLCGLGLAVIICIGSVPTSAQVRELLQELVRPPPPPKRNPCRHRNIKSACRSPLTNDGACRTAQIEGPWLGGHARADVSAA